MNTNTHVTATRTTPALSWRNVTLGVAMLGATALSSPVFAQSAPAGDAATIEHLSNELHSLQAQIDALRVQQAQTQHQVTVVTTKVATAPVTAPTSGMQTAAASTAAPVPGTAGASVHLGGVKITPGGFIEAAEIYRSRNETTDIGSSFGGIPLPNTSNYRTSEFRSSAHQSRLSLLAQGDYDNNLKLAAYYESDFISAAPTANSNESNSYNLRLRLAYATADYRPTGTHLLFGQGWSLLALNAKGITPHTEIQPAGIDAQYVVGYSWARQMQIRVVQDITPWAHIGFSVEEPQAVYAGTDPSGTIVNNPGTPQLNPLTTYSTDVAPDLIAKFAMDPGWGHYEVFGLARWFHDQTGLTTGTTGKGGNNTVTAGGVGGSAILPLVPNMVDFQISAMYGDGIGRYGSGGLADATVNAAGQPNPVREIQALAGLVAHPTAQLDLYAYAGIEQAARTAVSVVGANDYGYGNGALNNAGCWAIGGTCQAQTSSLRELTGGGWYKFYKGRYGMAEFGVQDEFITRNTFGARGGAPNTNMNVVMTSFRYYPF